MSELEKKQNEGFIPVAHIDEQAKRQLALFTEPNIDGNTLIGYDIRPRFLHTRASKVSQLEDYAEKGDKTFRLADGTVHAIKPALIVRDGLNVAVFPGTRESLVEECIMSFASKGEFNPGLGQPGYKYDSSGLGVYFTLHQLWRQMKDMNKTYAHHELSEALNVLKGAGHYTGTMTDFGDGKKRKADGYGSYISDLIYVDNDNPDPAIRVDKLICVTLNREATKLIIDGKYKLYDEIISMRMKTPIARYLYKKLIQQLSHSPNQSPHQSIKIKQNQCILESGYQIQDNATKRKNAFVAALNELIVEPNDFIEPIDETLISVTKEGRSIVEVEYTVFPTDKLFSYLNKVHEREHLQRDALIHSALPK